MVYLLVGKSVINDRGKGRGHDPNGKSLTCSIATIWWVFLEVSYKGRPTIGGEAIYGYPGFELVGKCMQILKEQLSVGSGK